MPVFDIEAIRKALPIERLLQSRGVCLRRGRGRCPVCGTSERSSAFSVRGDHWQCFACNARGDVVDLVAILDGVPVGEAIRRVARHAGLVPGAAPVQRHPRPKSAWQIARDALAAAWRPYLAAIQAREFVAAQYRGFVRRRGHEHPICLFVSQLLAEAYDREVLAEYAYGCALEALS